MYQIIYQRESDKTLTTRYNDDLGVKKHSNDYTGIQGNSNRELKQKHLKLNNRNCSQVLQQSSQIHLHMGHF